MLRSHIDLHIDLHIFQLGLITGACYFTEVLLPHRSSFYKSYGSLVPLHERHATIYDFGAVLSLQEDQTLIHQQLIDNLVLSKDRRCKYLQRTQCPLFPLLKMRLFLPASCHMDISVFCLVVFEATFSKKKSFCIPWFHFLEVLFCLSIFIHLENLIVRYVSIWSTFARYYIKETLNLI